MKLTPLNDRVVLKQLVAEETTKSGIVIPGQNKEKPQQAEVIAVGPGTDEVKMQVKVGDKVIYSNKLYALDFSIRSLSPSVVITDELSSFDDWKCVKKASDSGVKIIASIHGKTITDIRGKDCFIDGIFDRYVVLKSSGQAGVVENIYDKTFNLI